MACICCWATEMIFKAIFKEVIDIIQVGKREPTEILDEMEKDNETQTKIIRWISWLMNVIGHFLLFNPIIKLLSWIPLVGALLGGIVAFAVGIFALIWGSLLHVLILAAAWLTYRPLYAILLIAAIVGVILLITKTS